MNLKQTILAAAKADAIPAGESGLWIIKKNTVKPPCGYYMIGGVPVIVPAGDYTHLFRVTDSTMHVGGECVMEDTPRELNQHLQFMLAAHGDVLITGLGLGCVTRGTLANPAVKSVTVLEVSKDVLSLVEQHMPKDPRLTIVQAEAEEWIEQNTRKFDCVWHDVWTDTDRGEENLNIKHAAMIAKSSKFATVQGAWAMPRYVRRMLGNVTRSEVL